MEQTKKAAVGSILVRIGLCLLTFLAWLAFFSTIWYGLFYGDTGFDSVLFTLFGGIGGMQGSLLWDYVSGGLLPALLVTALQGLLFLPKNKKWLPNRLALKIGSLVLSVVLLVYSAYDIGLFYYAYTRMQPSRLYETEYVDPNTVDIRFPEQKRNLIYIYLESMETTFLDQSMGGAMEVNLIPELTELAQNNINFSHNETVGGLVEIPGATWSVGAMVAQTAGVPLITPRHIRDWRNGYGKDGVFLPGLTTMSNILAKNGYYQSLMMGCDSGFGGESVYAQTHDVNKIYDLFSGRQDGIVPQDYYAWWGFEDKYLFDYARQELTEIAQKLQPFAFTLLTMDTHREDGYTCSLCPKGRKEPFDNVLSCSSRQVADFIKWIQTQPFYENTTIVISGDHFSMDSRYIARTVKRGYARHGYNCIINAPIRAENTQNRIFSSLDMFPTTLAALGCQIEGDRLGLGVNLFSDEQTLPEAYGYSAFCVELSKRTDFYKQFYESWGAS